MTCKSYTGRANINIYNGDCMEFMKDKPAKSYDLAIIDIPYGLGEKLTQGGTWASKYKSIDAEWDVLPPKEYFEKLNFITFNQIIWGGNKNAKIFRHIRNTSEKRIHICQKPVALYKWLLTNYAKQGDKILDTHGGSMSIAIACWDLGFDLDIIELDKDYYDKALQRFERHINQKQIF
jgi:site-specific DNA-methyltransferase (adenine-specific)